MRTITEEQIKQIMELIYKGNPPIQIYDTVANIFNKLPVVENENKSN